MKKKILVITFALIILGAGQSLFAQTFNYLALLRTGMFVHFTDKVDDGPYIYGGSMEKPEPLYLLLKGYLKNENETAGIDTGFILKGLKIDPSSLDESYNLDYEVKLDNTFGWLKFLNGIFTLYGGYGEWEYDFRTPGPLDTNLDLQGLGMILVAKPLSTLGLSNNHDLRIGFSAFSKGGLTTLLNEGKYVISAKYQFNDIFQTVANFAFHQYGPKFYADEDAVNLYDPQKAKDHRIAFGINYMGLSQFGFSAIAFDMEMRDLGGGRKSKAHSIIVSERPLAARDPGVTVYPLYFGQMINWRNDDIRLNLSLSASQLLRIGDDHSQYAPAMKFTFTASYGVNAFIVPKLGVEYINNSTAWGDFPTDFNFNETVNWEDCIKDTSGLGGYVAVEFRLGGGTQNTIDLGYALRMDTSKDVEASASKSTFDQAIYTSVKISF